MSGKHTEGPWGVVDDYDILEISCDPEKSPYGIVTVAVLTGYVHLPVTDCPEVVANARLIAAAPDLLDALKAAMSELPDRCEHEREMARAAIAKAKGETP